MDNIRKYIQLFLMIFILSLILIFSMNYISSKTVDGFEYNMSKNYIKLKNSRSNLKKENIDFLLSYEDVDVITETDKYEVIGLYNPTMKYYLNSSKVNHLGVNRYFSNDDYVNKRNVAIYITQDLEHNNKVNIDSIEKYSGFKIINTFFENSDIYKPELKFVVNIFSLDTTNFTTVYIDSNNKKHLNYVKAEFEKIGFKEVENLETRSFSNILFDALNNRYSSFVFLSGLMSYMLFCYSFSVYLSKYRKYINLYLSYGTTFFSILKKWIKVLLIIDIFAFCISYFVSNIYLNYFYNSLSIYNYIKIYVFITFTTMFILVIRFYFMYRNDKKVMR